MCNELMCFKYLIATFCMNHSLIPKPHHRPANCHGFTVSPMGLGLISRSRASSSNSWLDSESSQNSRSLRVYIMYMYRILELNHV